MIEWNGISLFNLSYEQVIHIMDNSKDTVELILERKYQPTGQHAYHQRRRLSSGQISLESKNRRRLPKVPTDFRDEKSQQQQQQQHKHKQTQDSNKYLHTQSGSIELKSTDENSLNKRSASLRKNRYSINNLDALDSYEKNSIQVPIDANGKMIRRKSSSALNQMKRSSSLRSGIENENERMNESSQQQMTKSSKSTSKFGEIKLGIVLTKDMLEIDVIAARELPLSINSQPPGI